MSTIYTAKPAAEAKPWGKITWYFIHTFCEKIDEQFFMANKEKCFEVLSSICSMIPCPLCRIHAAQYLKKNPMARIIKNKSDLKIYFFNFHNQATLNGNPRAKIADVSTLDLYKKAVFSKIINAFSAEYTKRTPTRLDYTHTLFAQRILATVISFMKNNWSAFNVKQNIQPEEKPAAAEADNKECNITLKITDEL